VTLVLVACGGASDAGGEGAESLGSDQPATPAANLVPPGPVRAGASVLLTDSLHLVAGRRVGLMTNHTGIVQDGDKIISTIDLLHRHPDVELVALFSPEHGIRGTVTGGEKIDSSVDSETGLPIYSLYGETRTATPEMLAGIDVLLFDIQDIGVRYFTYVWGMALNMAAAGEAGIPFVVLDRPNPIGGERVQGNLVQEDQFTYVGLYPVPMRHGLTPGELARMLVGEFGISVDLTVVPVAGLTRDQEFEDTGLPWVGPSPNMPSRTSALHYAGTCIFEGTNVSVGRGTDIPFQIVGAPWLDAEALARNLNAAELPGAVFEAVSFTPDGPDDRKYDGQEVQGIRLRALSDDYDPTVAAVAILTGIQDLHPDRLEWREAHFDRLVGDASIRPRVQEGVGFGPLTVTWRSQSEDFDRRRQPFLIYPLP
jgi:uncharacterized protein YbbC (DUF1343 family)